jgi:ATP-binding cassette subfamily B protein
VITEGALAATRYEPVAEQLRYRPPSAGIHPDTSLGWVRRVWPLLRSRWQAFAVAIAVGVIALVVQVQIPAVLRDGVDNALDTRTEPLARYVWLLLGLAVARFVTGALYRYLLFRAGYLFETDLRAIMYEHLTRLSFSYYDRTQSGQVISRANSDIR